MCVYELQDFDLIFPISLELLLWISQGMRCQECSLILINWTNEVNLNFATLVLRHEDSIGTCLVLNQVSLHESSTLIGFRSIVITATEICSKVIQLTVETSQLILVSLESDCQLEGDVSHHRRLEPDILWLWEEYVNEVACKCKNILVKYLHGARVILKEG